MYNPVRGGNRGGKDQFKWENVRTLAYKDRECYLGSTVAIGFLDKGGKWRKKDWWINLKEVKDQQSLEMEKRQVQLEDERRMRQALGLETKANDDLPNLNQYELDELTKKISKNEGNEERDERLPGLGFNMESNLKVRIAEGEKEAQGNLRLEGEGIKQKEQKDKKEKNHEKSKKIKKEKKKKEKKEKKEKSKDKKKEKEVKKHHEKRRSRERSSSSSSSL